MLKVIKQLLKIIAAAIISFCILNGLCFFYYNLAMATPSETGSTDYVWEDGVFYSRATEGIASGRIDEKGFNNAYEGDVSQTDVLVMGSSQMEGFNVDDKFNAVYRLNELYEENGVDKYAYNIGMSSHTLLMCLNNLDSAIAEFNRAKTIVIETPTIHINEADLQLLVDNNLPEITPEENSFLRFMARFPFVRLMYAQFSELAEGSSVAEPEATEEISVYTDNLKTVLQRAVTSVSKNSAELVILYNPNLSVGENGAVQEQVDENYVVIMESLCDELGIQFINMYEPFVDYYEKTNRLPHGFSNTRVGAGHLNRFGHEVIAQTLFDELQIKEGD